MISAWTKRNYEAEITPETLEHYAHTNASFLKNPPRAMVVAFRGLGASNLIEAGQREDSFYADRDLLYVVPYTNPWCWMNDLAVLNIECILSAIDHKYGKVLPMVSCGLSMGGLGALMFPLKTKRKVLGIAANCPVCTLLLPHGEYEARMDVPKTVLSAFSDYDGPLEEALRENSPMTHMKDYPKFPIYIVHGEADNQVFKVNHSDIFVKGMKELGYNITYREIPGMGHCALPDDVFEEYMTFCANLCKDCQ